MAFVCALKEGWEPSLFLDAGSHALLIPVGYDDEEDKSYYLSLELNAGVAVEALDFMFSLIEYDGETDAYYAYFSGRDTVMFLTGDDRTMVLIALLKGVRHLLGAAQPDKVELSTMDPTPPGKANRKFMLLGQVFELCGYEVHRAAPYHGQQVWWMERRVPSSIENDIETPPGVDHG